MATTMDQMNALVQDQTNKINFLYQQLEEVRAAADAASRAAQAANQAAESRNKGGAKGMTHAKHFNPGKYSNLRGEQAFRPWAGDVKIMALRYSKILHEAMNRMEYQKTPVRREEVAAAGVTPEDDMELSGVHSRVRALFGRELHRPRKSGS